ncbi:alpha/beta hydrolase, partial [Helicobacter sp. CaF467b]|uniref:alpha/beta hydrolase n=1 Tax=Helicobacter sp. CaF467b TaxID=2919923 RepID=UPI001F582A17
VSPFDEELKKLPIFRSFTDKKPSYQILKNVIKNRVVISAKDDAIVPTNLSYKLARSLDADFIQTQKGGHFMESEGYTDLPLVIEVFQNFSAESKQ